MRQSSNETMTTGTGGEGDRIAGPNTARAEASGASGPSAASPVDRRFAVEPPAIALPKGGGAIRDRHRPQEGQRWRRRAARREIPTFTKLDAEGKPLWIRDARGNLVMQYITPPKPTRWSSEPNEDMPERSVPCYDIAGNLLYQHSMDGGDRWTIADAAGQPFYAWDVNGIKGSEPERRVYRTRYDALHRPLERQLSLDGGEGWQTIERFVYGDRPAPFLSPEQALERNLRGRCTGTATPAA